MNRLINFYSITILALAANAFGQSIEAGVDL